MTAFSGSFENLVTSAYEAGMDPAGWGSFCSQVGDVLGGGVKIMMQGHDLRTRSHLGTLTANYDPALVAAYDDHYSKINPWLPGMLLAPMDRIVTDTDLLPRADLVKTEFWADFIRPLDDMGGGAGAILFRDGERLLVLTGNYNWNAQDKHRNETISTFERLAPHVRTAFRIQRMLEGSRLATEASLSVLDGLQNAVFLVTRSGRISFANSSAEGLLRTGSYLYVDQNRSLRCHDRDADRTLAQGLYEIATGTVAPARDGFAARSGQSALPVLCAIVPFHPPPRARSAFSGFPLDDDPVAMVTVKDPSSRPIPSAQALSALYRLTPAETALALALSAGQTLSDYADERRLSRHTVRNQLRAVLDKVGVHGQSELVSALARLS